MVNGEVVEAHAPGLPVLGLAAKVFAYGASDEPLDTAVLSEPGTWLLFPDGPTAPPDAPPPSQLVVVDARWRPPWSGWRRSGCSGSPTAGR